mgnify:FL=1
MEYSYPLSLDWSTQEIVDVVAFFEAVEAAYEKGIIAGDFLRVYRRFKEVVPSQAEEKTICRDYEEASSYVPYHVVKAAKEADPAKKIRVEVAQKRRK